jgi:hypothetical protein
VWISLLESAEVAFVTRQSNVPDLRWVNVWRRGLLETLLRLSCEWDVFREERLQIESLRGSAGFGYFVVTSCIEVWVSYNVIMTEVRHLNCLPSKMGWLAKNYWHIQMHCWMIFDNVCECTLRYDLRKMWMMLKGRVLVVQLSRRKHRECSELACKFRARSIFCSLCSFESFRVILLSKTRIDWLQKFLHNWILPHFHHDRTAVLNNLLIAWGATQAVCPLLSD